MKENLGKKYDAAANAEAAKNVEQLMTLEDLRAIAEDLAAEANTAIAKNKIGEYAGIMGRLNKTVEEYSDLAQRQVFSKCRETENPKLEAAKIRYIDIIAAKVTNNPSTKMPAKVEIMDKTKMIDLLKLCEFCGLPTVWWTSVAAYCQWLALQVSDNIGMSDGYKQELIKKFKISDDAKKVDMTRFSNSEKVSTLQSIVDEMVFVPGKTQGKNALRVNNHDLEYVMMCLTREGKGAGVVRFIDDKGLRRILTNVCHRLAIGGIYTLSYKEIRPKAVPVAEVVSEKVVTPAKDSAPKANQESGKKGVTRVKKERAKKANQDSAQEVIQPEENPEVVAETSAAE